MMSAIDTARGTPRTPILGVRGARPKHELNDGNRMPGVGLAIASQYADDHFVAALVHALAEPVIAQGWGLYTRVVADDAAAERIYRHWAVTEGIAGVALLDVDERDPRVDLIRSLGLPFAAVTDADHSADFPAVIVDVTATVRVVQEFLQGSGHDRAVFIVADGAPELSRSRAAAIGDRWEVVRTDRSPSSAVTAASSIVEQGPATVLFDSDVHAAAAVAAFTQRGLQLPRDVSVVSWTDSSLCQSTTPSITALNRRGGEIGALLGRKVLETIAGERATSVLAPHPFVAVRETA